MNIDSSILASRYERQIGYLGTYYVGCLDTFCGPVIISAWGKSMESGPLSGDCFTPDCPQITAAVPSPVRLLSMVSTKHCGVPIWGPRVCHGVRSWKRVHRRCQWKRNGGTGPNRAERALDYHGDAHHSIIEFMWPACRGTSSVQMSSSRLPSPVPRYLVLMERKRVQYRESSPPE